MLSLMAGKSYSIECPNDEKLTWTSQNEEFLNKKFFILQQTDSSLEIGPYRAGRYEMTYQCGGKNEQLKIEFKAMDEQSAQLKYQSIAPLKLPLNSFYQKFSKANILFMSLLFALLILSLVLWKFLSSKKMNKLTSGESVHQKSNAFHRLGQFSKKLKAVHYEDGRVLKPLYEEAYLLVKGVIDSMGSLDSSFDTSEKFLNKIENSSFPKKLKKSSEEILKSSQAVRFAGYLPEKKEFVSFIQSVDVFTRESERYFHRG